MFDATGAVLIDRTQVDDLVNGNTNTRPAIEVNATGIVFVVWENMTASQVRFMRLDPSQALLDGNPTTQALIKDQIIGEVIIGNNAAHPRIRIDANGDLHVVWESTSGGDVQYVKIDDAGAGVLPVIGLPVSLGSAASTASGNDLPDIDVDTNGHAHVVFGNIASGMMENEIYYAMVDGATGAVLIDTTLLSDDDGLRAGNATVNVDTFDNTVYVVFKQALTNAVNDGAEEIFLARLDPSPASQTVLKLFETQITNGEGLFHWHVTSNITSDKRIHATYIDFDESTCLMMGPDSPLTQLPMRTSRLPERWWRRDVLTTTGSATSCFPQARSAPGRNRITWTDIDIATGTREILSSFIVRADTGSRGFTCSLSNRDASGWNVGDLWLLLSSIAGLGLWRKFRNQRRA